MPLTSCPACGRQASSLAARCPGCGHPTADPGLFGDGPPEPDGICGKYWGEPPRGAEGPAAVRGAARAARTESAWRGCAPSQGE
ncbi:MAG: hypothetical protein LBQ12_00810 [Deltaproteobacteria bacterium]|nr:hypothetical protein [Deltaproteobacteria bacterium]